MSDIHYIEISDEQLKRVSLALFKKEIRDAYVVEFVAPIPGTRRWIVKLTKKPPAPPTAIG